MNKEVLKVKNKLFDEVNDQNAFYLILKNYNDL